MSLTEILSDRLMMVFVIVILLALPIAFSIVATMEANDLAEQAQDQIDRSDDFKDLPIGGLYVYSHDMICVVIDDKTTENIDLSYTHEMCHWHVEQDYGHFCLNQTQRTGGNQSG